MLKLGLLTMLLAMMTPQAAAVQDKPPIIVYVDGERMNFDRQHPYSERGVTLVPFRPIFAKLGLSMEWDALSRKVTGRKHNLLIELQIGSTTAWVNGKSYPLDVAPVLRDGQTFIPLRFVSEHAEREVIWNESKRLIYIAKRDDLIYYLVGEALRDTGSGQAGMVASDAKLSYSMKELKSDQALVEAKSVSSTEESIWHYRVGYIGGQWKVLNGQLRYVRFLRGEVMPAGDITTSQAYQVVIRAVLEASLADQADFHYTLGKLRYLSGDDREVRVRYQVLTKRTGDRYYPDHVTEHVTTLRLHQDGQWRIVETNVLSRDYRVDAVVGFR